MTQLFITFCVLNVINVILQTIKSLVTIKCGKWSAATMNAIAFGLYQVIIVYAVCDLPLAIKIVVVAIANFIGVFCTKLVEEKLRKDKLWKVEVNVIAEEKDIFIQRLNQSFLAFNYIDDCGCGWITFNVFSYSQKDSLLVKKCMKGLTAKYFVVENKGEL